MTTATRPATEAPELRAAAEMFFALGEPTRLLILRELARGPRHVGWLSERLNVPMVNMSHHLGVMQRAGVLDSSKDGRRVVYRLNAAAVIEAAGGLGLRVGPYVVVVPKGK